MSLLHPRLLRELRSHRLLGNYHRDSLLVHHGYLSRFGVMYAICL